MVKKSKGRQKIEMVKMKNESNLQVTFSKRRSGLFKKASELCTLCGADIAIITFSPGRKVFSFGHPSVETVIDRFINNNNPNSSNEHNHLQLSDVHRNVTVADLNNHLTQVLDQLELEKKKNEELKKIRETNKMPENWWENPIEGLDLNQATQFKGTLEKMKNIVTLEASKIFQANVPQQNFYVVGSSSNDPFGVDGTNTNINPDSDQLGQRRMMNMNAFYNPNANAVLPNHLPQFGNNSHGNISEGYVPEYNVDYKPEYNQSQNQSQNMSFKQENISEYEHHHHHGHRPDHSRSDY